MNQDKSLAYLTLVTALLISAVAIYYSVSGLVAIFAAYPVAIILMGGILESAKLVAAVWLHKYWDRAQKKLRSYLIFAVVTLMVLTSVGIFGFLSKAHTEQAAAGAESVAQIERVVSDIARQEAIIARAEERVGKIESGGSGADATLQAQIDREQGRIDQAFARIEQAQKRIEGRLEPFETELNQLDTVLKDLQTAINNQDTRKAQSLVGTRPDGQYGPATAAAVQDFRDRQNTRRQEILAEIDKIRSSDTAIVLAENQVQESTELVNRLRNQLGQGESQDVDQLIDEQNARIKAANDTLDSLTEEKFQLQAVNRDIEAKVGPIKFIAEFIYGESDKTILEKAVSWMIVLIVVVFDPLAVVLLIASQYTFMWARNNDEGQTQEEVIEFDAEENLNKILDDVKNDVDPDDEILRFAEEAAERMKASIPKEDDLVEQIVKNIDLLENEDIQAVLEENPDMVERLENYLDREVIVKPKEDILTDKTNEINFNKGWL